MLTNVLWMNPLWLWALPLAVLTPLAAHLLARRGGRLAVFPSIRLIRQAANDQARLRRVRDWLLLLLRMLALSAVVIAFARPAWCHSHAPGIPESPGQGKAVVLLLDASASMQRHEQGVSLFDRARRQVIEALRSLDPSRDRALVVLVDANPRPMLPRMSGHFSQLIELLETASPTWEAGDLAGALAMALNPPMQPGESIEPTAVEIHLFGDMQRSQWPGPDHLSAMLGQRKLVTHPVGGFEGNLALRDAHVTPAVPIVGQEALAQVELANFSDTPADTQVEMTIHFPQGKPIVQVQSARLPAGGKAQLTFPWRATGQGVGHLQFSIKGDGGALQADDRTGRFVTVQQARQVALVSLASEQDDTASAFYLKRALMPMSAGQGNDVAVERWRPGELAGGLALRPPACVVMVGVGGLDDVTLASLHAYLARGGGVWWIIDSPQSANSLSGWRDAQGQAVSPIIASGDSAWRTGVEATLSGGAFEDAMLRVFDGPVRSALLSPRFDQVLMGSLSPDAQMLLAFNAGHPALAGRWIGAGRLMVLAGNISPQRSDLVKLPIFLPLVHQVVRHLAPGPAEAGNLVVGSRLSLAFAMPAGSDADALRVVGPDGLSRRPMAVLPLGEGWEVEWSAEGKFPGTFPGALPGAFPGGGYRVVQAGREDWPVAGVQVDVASAESDLATWLPTDEASSKNTPAADRGRPVEAPVRLQENPVELWPWLLVSAGVLLMGESLLAGLLTRGHGARTLPGLPGEVGLG